MVVGAHSHTMNIPKGNFSGWKTLPLEVLEQGFHLPKSRKTHAKMLTHYHFYVFFLVDSLKTPEAQLILELLFRTSSERLSYF
ncbi:hypothetical protein T4B_3832 [Trichinella pseudospiralis]|uniref:Uncharacterized protein n=1 Tax=Trichinella pseudospiralis TaxID=6337 RepID=A0A0V1ES53_TRIPS|nr:hypothetical protein T4A_31 [Trichinella pseudospiralis]KRZ17689.1 hypothetical protein T4B_3832 [Trichinella pseudospiralis]